MKLLLVMALLFSPLLARAEPANVATPTEWNGFKRLDFVVAGRPCLLIVPAKTAPGSPWIWRTEFFGHFPQADLALLARGWHVAYMNAQDMYGAPPAMALFRTFHDFLGQQYGLNPRVVLEGLSRGGLYAFNFAVAHPDWIAALYLDAPALDIRSWPGRNHASKEWAECLAIYGLTEKTAQTFKDNPLDHIDAVAKAGIPIIVVCGAADTTVPVAENTAILERRYHELGGTIQVISKPGVGHHPHSLEDPSPIVNFLVEHATF